MSTTQAFGWISAAGNRFALHDAIQSGLLDPKSVSSQLRDVDGLLLMAPPTAGGTCRMIVYNRDGSRAEACGNGLRAVALFARQRGLCEQELTIETDAGPRSVRLLEGADGEVVAARSSMGAPRWIGAPLDVAIGSGHTVKAVSVDCGNPHLVLFLDACSDALVESLGPELEVDERFPERTNVEFAVLRGGEFVTRVWERGVGETAACGTGAVAVAFAALQDGIARGPIAVRMPGGLLRVDFDGDEAWLEGPVQDHPAGF